MVSFGKKKKYFWPYFYCPHCGSSSLEQKSDTEMHCRTCERDSDYAIVLGGLMGTKEHKIPVSSGRLVYPDEPSSSPWSAVFRAEQKMREEG